MNRPDRTGLIANLGLAIAAVLLMNGLIAIVNPAEMSSARSVPFEPPGYVIGLVWIVLFACLGAARWLVLGSPQRDRLVGRLIVYLTLFCLAYPVYTLGLRSHTIALAGNVATILFAAFVVLRVRQISQVAAALVSLVAVWVSFATLLIIEQTS